MDKKEFELLSKVSAILTQIEQLRREAGKDNPILLDRIHDLELTVTKLEGEIKTIDDKCITYPKLFVFFGIMFAGITLIIKVFDFVMDFIKSNIPT